MFRPSWKQRFVATVLLLGGTVAAPTVHADPIPPSEIDGVYGMTDLGNQPEDYPVSFSLSGGLVILPPDLTPFAVADFGVFLPSGGKGTPVTLTNISDITHPNDFTLSGGILGTIDYHIDSAVLVSPVAFNADIHLMSNTTSIVLTNLDPAVLIISFPPEQVSFDPHWAGFFGPVTFQIVPAVPEPASIVHLTWVGVFGVVGYWRRRRAARAVAA